jgi:hypothetical protein
MLLRNVKPAIVSELCKVSKQRCYSLKQREKQQLQRGLQRMRLNNQREKSSLNNIRVATYILRLLKQSSARQFSVKALRDSMKSQSGFYVPSYYTLRKICIEECGI